MRAGARSDEVVETVRGRSAVATPAAVDAAVALAPDELARRAMSRRAVEAVIRGMPVVNYDLMYQAAFRAGGGVNQIVYWSRLPRRQDCEVRGSRARP